jgi:predicted transcriptional regulator
MWNDERQPSEGERTDGSGTDLSDGIRRSQEVLDCLGDGVCRSILIAAVPEPKSASELADACGVSRSTVYRRLNRLVDLGLVSELARTDIDARAGSSVFRTQAERLELEVTADGFTIRTPDPESADAESTAPEVCSSVVETESGPMAELQLRVPIEYAERLAEDWSAFQSFDEERPPQTGNETA